LTYEAVFAQLLKYPNLLPARQSRRKPKKLHRRVAVAELPVFFAYCESAKLFKSMKNILVPTDFSENARNALRYAVHLAQLFDSQLTVLHTFSITRRSDMMKSMDNIMRRDAEDQMRTLGADIPAEISWKHKIVQGDTILTIAGQAEELKADLIVMGTQGASGWEEVFIGSVTGGVMRQTQVPLLAIPENFSYSPIKKIVLAMNTLEASDPKQMVRPLRMLAQKTGAHVNIYHHDKEHGDLPDAVTEAANWLGEVPVSLTYEQDAEHVNENIANFVAAEHADLLCLVRRDRRKFGFFERFFQESVTLTQVFRSEVPLLILHAE
jgi:nucleotide-binding universal stress UspA family protein